MDKEVMRRGLVITGLILGAVVLLAGSVGAERRKFKADLTGAGHRPPVLTDTTGKFKIKFNRDQTQAKFRLKVKQGVALTEAHLHCNEGIDGPIVAFLFGAIPGGVDVNGKLVRSTLRDQDLAAPGTACGIANLRDLRRAMEDGKVYVNVQSVANPSGEIRGQITYNRKDTDADGVRDKRDPDIDGDGILNADDPTPYGALLLGGPPRSSPPLDQGSGSAGPRAPFWPATAGQPLVGEWYTDIPWHQKLGTFAGNEIDEPLVLPYAALTEADRKYCKTQDLSRDECMLEVGINNILGAYRTDTLYDPNDGKIKNASECQDATLPCIEVKLELSSFWTRSNDGSDVELEPRPFGREPQHQPDPPFEENLPSYYGGYTITDGSTYAPQMPWYMSHYCDAFYSPTADTQDPVCYADYFSPFNAGFNLLPMRQLDQWPRSVPWSIFPSAEPPGPTNHCKEGETVCTMALAGFDLKEVPEEYTSLQYEKYNDFLVTWFNSALTNFPADRNNTRHFPWTGTPIDWPTFIYSRATHNPFLGTFADEQTDPPRPNAESCNTTVDGNGKNCTNTGNLRATHYLYPRMCRLGDLTEAAAGMKTAVDRLRQCGLNYELHHNGYWVQWPRTQWGDVLNSGMIANQYGRTSFLFAGVPGMQLPVSFYKEVDASLSIYERVYNASIFSLYMPITNVADDKRAFSGRNYTDTQFYHTLLMSNHMESDPWEFAEGIRGKVLWHNEYRTEKMYENGRNTFAPDFTFAAGFAAATAPSPFHNNTCDGCHVRNGSGIPINTDGTLDPKLQEFMRSTEYKPYNPKDYTFTGEIRPMKLVFFDLKRDTANVDASRYSEPMSFPDTLFAAIEKLPRPAEDPPQLEGLNADDLYYNNAIMNFYGDSFHVTAPGYGYKWYYVMADAHNIVDGTARKNPDTGQVYEPNQALVESFETPYDHAVSPCKPFVPNPGTTKPWPDACTQIDGDAIGIAINGTNEVKPQVGFILLNGKRLGNLSAIEAIPNQAILDFHGSQKAQLLKKLVENNTENAEKLAEEMAGEVIWNAGSRDGVDGKVYKVCKTASLADCFIGRFGWLGDRVSLEDQVANAAFVEMNITTTEGYDKLYPKGNAEFPIRYGFPNCGPANKTCVESAGNSDLSEADVERMADYARWLGNPTRSEFQVSQPEVIEGEQIFRNLACNTCHVIDKIEIVDPDDTMTSKFFRDRLATRVTQSGDYPFLSYLGTDLLMHDMGYLSQVGTTAGSIRDEHGVVKPEYENYVQKVRTPPLKGLRFNRFVTDAHRNTKAPGDPACDFLLHDGRACDAIEAAFLHDGPAIKVLGVIEGLNALTKEEIKALRAFLYSL